MKNIPVRNITAIQEQTLWRFSIRRVDEILNGNDLQQDLYRNSFLFILILQTGEGIHEIDITPNVGLFSLIV